MKDEKSHVFWRFQSEYFNEYPLSFQTTDDAIIEGTEIIKVPTGKEISFNQEYIEPIDWGKYGTDIKVEFSNDSSVNDIYEVLGQANKSVSWFSTKGKFIEKMLSRHKSSHCQDMVGSFEELIKNLKSPEVHLSGVITIVQPALSKTIKMDDKVQRVLAATANYINHSSKVKNLRILGSK